MTTYIQGTCDEMCPIAEVKMRSKERLLHYFELENGAPHKPVKCFARSAAGVRAPKKTDLRTIPALERTIDYLLKDIVMNKKKSYGYVYDFVFDRLRCVRQEIVIQNLKQTDAVKLLEPIVMFLAYSRYRLTEESIDNFDPQICDQHLQECMKKVLCCYDELDMDATYCPTIMNEKNRILIETMYQLFNLGKVEALNRSFNLKPELSQHPTYRLSKRMSLEYCRGNYYKCLQLSNKLHHILGAIASLKLNHIRRQILLQFSHAYNNKQLMVPIAFVQKTLLYTSRKDLIDDLAYYNIDVSQKDEAIRFIKTNFDVLKQIIPPKHEPFVEDKLKKIYLPELLTLKKYTL